VSTKLREVLPNWSPDGKHLYFTAAPSYYDSLNFDEVYYDLMRIEFDAASNTFGKLDTVYQASKNKRTLSFPKISPDGKQILFTGASHGYFTIYNQTSDLYLLNLASGTVEPYPFNSPAVESYHEWSSNGRWVVFSSKRIDGLTTRPFISYYDEKGKWYKPFVLPQKDPLFYRSFNLNYNIPHLSDGAVTVNRQQLLKAVWGEAKQAQFDSNVDVDALSGASKIEKGTSLH
jgi:Tol biopolymer transport system component